MACESWNAYGWEGRKTGAEFEKREPNGTCAKNGHQEAEEAEGAENGIFVNIPYDKYFKFWRAFRVALHNRFKSMLMPHILFFTAPPKYHCIHAHTHTALPPFLIPSALILYLYIAPRSLATSTLFREIGSQ